MMKHSTIMNFINVSLTNYAHIEDLRIKSQENANVYAGKDNKLKLIKQVFLFTKPICNFLTLSTL